jgi:hypothetical protein
MKNKIAKLKKSGSDLWKATKRLGRRYAYSGRHKVSQGGTHYVKAGAVHEGTWYDTPTGALPIAYFGILANGNEIKGVW